jgi:hypothetical protein
MTEIAKASAKLGLSEAEIVDCMSDAWDWDDIFLVPADEIIEWFEEG